MAYKMAIMSKYGRFEYLVGYPIWLFMVKLVLDGYNWIHYIHLI